MRAWNRARDLALKEPAAFIRAMSVADSARDLSPAQLRARREPFNVFQLDAVAYPGNSGSPVYLAGTGEVIGVVNSVFVNFVDHGGVVRAG